MTPTTISHPDDPDVVMHVPDVDVNDPELSIVIPALNEGLTIVEFVEWCHLGMAEADIVGEIIIVDSSTDDTAEKALAGRARVLKTPKRGLGRAYIDALPFVRGKYVLMGDADCTYDFRRLSPFVKQFRAGDEFVMGSRWKGTIEKGAMPKLHQYFGTPFTTWILNRLYASRFSDIHCGMRGLSTDAFRRMGLSSQSWEYASEIVLKSVHMDLRTSEVPVTFRKDKEGRLSHHKRSGWMSPFAAAWINLRAMFVYGADFFLVKPGSVLFVLGLLLTLPLSAGAVTVGTVTFSLYWMLLGFMMAVVGLHSVFLGLIAQTFYDYSGKRRQKLLRRFRYTRSVVFSWSLMLAGFLAVLPLIVSYVREGLSLPNGIDPWGYLAITGLLAGTSGFALFAFTLVLHAAALPRWLRDH